MKILEQFIKGRYNDPKLCEDAICVTHDFIAVIDGVNSQSDFRFEDKKLGKIISDILVEAIEKLDGSLNCYETVDFLNECIINYYKDKGFYDQIADDQANQPSASVIMYSRKYRQIWLIGDCVALYGNEILTFVKMDLMIELILALKFKL